MKVISFLFVSFTSTCLKTMRFFSQQKDLSRFAVDSGKAIDEDSLAEYTGSVDRVFNYDRNAEFAKKLLNEVKGSRCIQVRVCRGKFFIYFSTNKHQTIFIIDLIGNRIL